MQKLLLKDLDLKRYPTIREIDNAVNRAEKAVQAYATANPKLFDAGTDYITKSLGFIDKDFRKKHGFSTATLNSFGMFKNLVKPDG